MGSTVTPHFEIVEKLSLREQFRLVEIAHETNDSDIKKAALSVLKKYLNPLIMMVDAQTVDSNMSQGDRRSRPTRTPSPEPNLTDSTR